MGDCHTFYHDTICLHADQASCMQGRYPLYKEYPPAPRTAAHIAPRMPYHNGCMWKLNSLVAYIMAHSGTCMP